MRRAIGIGVGLCLSLAGAPAWSQGSLGSNTQHVVLVKDCEDAGWDAGDVGSKCFESVSALTDYIWGASGIWPTASTPLTVDIGPGEFAGRIFCPEEGGHVTFRGAGRDRSILKWSNGGGPFPDIQIGVHVNACESLGFQDLGIFAENTATPSLGYGVFWVGGGSSTWTDVDLTGSGAGWYDAGCGGDSTDASAGVHYFWGSTVKGSRLGYFAECGETWFYGGEIDAFSSIAGSFSNPTTGVWVSHRGMVQMFGSSLRVSTAGVSSGSGAAHGVRVGPAGNMGTPTGYGEFHSHGGVISVNTSNLSGVTATGITLNDASGTGDAKSHTLDTAFAIKGASTVKRLGGSGSFESPFLWEARTDPPPAGGQKDGQDIYVETDCGASDCSGGSDPHLMIYKASCSPTPWFDIVRNECRD